VFLDAASVAVTLLLPLPLVITANGAIGKPWAHHATGILAGFAAGGVFLLGFFDIATSRGGWSNPNLVDVGYMVTGVVAASLVTKPVREWLARYMPIDPDNPVHSIALVLAVILLGTQVASVAFSDVLKQDLQLPPLSIADLAAQEVPFLVIAIAGVGLFIRRSTRASSERLGLVKPAWWHITLALGAAGAFWGLSEASQWLSQTLTPDIASKVATTSAHIFGGLGGPVGVAALALLPGICEEALFRGALQPRLGLLATAVLFTAIHTEYGLSIDVVTIFVIAIGLGLVRRFANTTASTVCHVAYNTLIGIGLTGTYQVAADIAVVLLIAVTAYEIWRRRILQPLPAEDQADTKNQAVS
jgi:CAAX protease family protein